MITHLNLTERPVKCKVCPKTFVDTSALTKHMYYHSDVRSFKCDFCDKKYKTRKDTKQHMKRVHPDVWKLKS